MKALHLFIVATSLLFLGACTTAPYQSNYDWTAFEATNPRSILVLPVLNNTVDVDAPLFALSTLSIPLGEKGYYVFPVNTVKTTLEHEGLYEGQTIKNLGTPALSKMFGADCVLYVEINRWDAQYILLSTTVTVSIDYEIQNPEGQRIWSETVTTQYTPQNSSSGSPMADLIAAAITAGMTRAAPDYIPLMNQANQQAFVTGAKALPPGPYLKIEK